MSAENKSFGVQNWADDLVSEVLKLLFSALILKCTKKFIYRSFRNSNRNSKFQEKFGLTETISGSMDEIGS